MQEAEKIQKRARRSADVASMSNSNQPGLSAPGAREGSEQTSGEELAVDAASALPVMPAHLPGQLLSAEQERLMIEHLPIVRFIARRIHERLPQHVPIEDLYSAGVVGLLDALSKFDPSKQVQFRSYAQFRIRGAVLDSLRTLDWSPRELRRKGRAVEQAIQTLTARVGRTPTDIETTDTKAPRRASLSPHCCLKTGNIDTTTWRAM